VSSVLQPWVEALGWKEQSILLSGFRGPDSGAWPHTKAVGRWLRRVSQNNADPSKDYMREDKLPGEYDLCDELEWQSGHFIHHIADALRVVSLRHPDSLVRAQAHVYHYTIAEEIFHFMPEPEVTFTERHRDKVEHA
jgi:hypothetical protein